VVHQWLGTAGAPGPRRILMDAVAGEQRGSAECALQIQGSTDTTREVVSISGGGAFRDVEGRPAAGATVRITNSPPDQRSFTFVANANGIFRFVDLPLTPTARLVVSSDPFHPVVDVEFPRDLFRGDGINLVLEQVQVRVAGRVVVSQGGQDEPVPYARVLAVQEAGERLVGAADAAGVINLTVPLETLGSPNRGTLRVELPDALTLGGRFEPGSRQTLTIDPTRGTVDVGTVRFRGVPNADPTVRMAGSLYVRDSLDRPRSKGVEGLVLRAVDAGSGRVMAETVTRAGQWSLTLPQGTYVFEAPNSASLGLAPLPRSARRIEFGREDLQNGLDRIVPELVVLEPQRLVFTYPELRGLPVEQVVLRVNDQVVDLVASLQRDGERFTVTLASALKPEDRVELAVRIDELLTLFSVAQTVGGTR
jgi:hypothetical protein